MDTTKRAKVNVFAGKDKRDRIQGILTKVGMLRFEQARVRLSKIIGANPKQISDGDTAEYLARGPEDTVRYLTHGKTR